MYHLNDIIPSGADLNLIPDVSFNPDGTLFAVTYLNSNEVVIFDARTRSAMRVFKNPEAGFDSPHGVLLTENHLIVSNVHGMTRPSSFTVYDINASSGEPVSIFITPHKYLREAHSLAVYNNVIVVTYCHNTEGSGAVVSYQFDDNAGVIQAPLNILQTCFENFGDPKGIAFSKDGRSVFVTYVTQKKMSGLPKYIRRAKATWVAWKEHSVKEFLQHIRGKIEKRAIEAQTAQKKNHNGIAIFGIDSAGRFNEKPTSVFERDKFCRLENVDIVGDTVVICDTINGSVCLYDLKEDPQLQAPEHTVTENISLPHGAKLSPDKSMLVVTNYGLKVANQVIHWGTPSSGNDRGVLVYDLKSS